MSLHHQGRQPGDVWRSHARPGIGDVAITAALLGRHHAAAGRHHIGLEATVTGRAARRVYFSIVVIVDRADGNRALTVAWVGDRAGVRRDAEITVADSYGSHDAVLDGGVERLRDGGLSVVGCTWYHDRAAQRKRHDTDVEAVTISDGPVDRA